MKPIYLTAPLKFEAAAGDDLPRTFAGVAYSGGHVPGYDMVVDIATAIFEAPMHLLRQHNTDRVIGINSQITGGNTLEVSGDLFSDIDNDAADIARKSKRGTPWEMSIGIWEGTLEYIAEGLTVTVNGRNFTGPVRVLRKANIREISVVALGADDETRMATFFQFTPPNPETNMDLEAAKARIAALEAELSALKTERDGLNTKLAEANTSLAAVELAAKTSLVKRYFAATGKKFDDAAAKPYLACSPHAWG